jgi:hypothetical protein
MQNMDDNLPMMTRRTPSNSSPDIEPDRMVAGLIARLLLHFWTPQELSDGARKAMAADWLSDLREFGPDTVSRACGEWRRMQTRRPTIADIRKLCIEDRELHRSESQYEALTGPNARDVYARSVGFSSWLERQDAIDRQQEAYRKAEAWRKSPAAVQGFKSPAAALGVTAREYTSEEMAAGRRQIGIEDTTP